MKKNYYELLELPLDASQKQIKAAMIRLGKIYAARAQKDDAARASFHKITEAYKMLSNPYKRTGYDDLLKQSLKESNTGKNWHSRFKEWAGWQVGKQQTMKGWEIAKQQTIKVWEIGKQPVFQSKKIAKPQTVTSKTKKRKITKEWKIGKQRATKRCLDKMFVPGERIMHQARTHWFFYVDFGAMLVVIFSGYFLLISPAFVGEDMPTVLLWVPKFISKDKLEMSVWYLGLIALLFVGLMMLWEAFIIGQTTELAITSKRILFKSGLLNRTIIEIKLRQFESIKIHQNIVGLILNYGTVTIGGMGGAKTSVPNIVAPFRLRKMLWLVLEEMEHREDDLKNANG